MNVIGNLTDTDVEGDNEEEEEDNQSSKRSCSIQKGSRIPDRDTYLSIQVFPGTVNPDNKAFRILVYGKLRLPSLVYDPDDDTLIPGEERVQ